MDNTDMFDLFSQMLKEEWVSDAKRCWGVASPSQLLHVVQKLLSVICDQYIWSWHFQLKHVRNVSNAESS